MIEFWTPRPYDRPNVSNIYDMMVLYQEQLDSAETHENRKLFASFAATALKRMFARMPEDRKDLMVISDLTLIQDYDGDQSAVIEQGIGLNGKLRDINCLQVPEALTPMALSLSIDVFTLFPAEDPDHEVMLLNNAKTPINNVRYIETIETIAS